MRDNWISDFNGVQAFCTLVQAAILNGVYVFQGVPVFAGW